MIIYPDMYKNTGKDHTMVNEPAYVNVNIPERIFSIAAGSFLIYSGIKVLLQNPITGISKLAAGSVLFVRGASGHCPAYGKLGTNSTKTESINIKQHFTVNKPREEVFQFWRKLENLPLFMRHLESVEQTDDVHSHWKAKFTSYLPVVSWNAEIVKERENEFIGWHSIEGSIIENGGKVEFRDALNGSGTEVQVVFSYHAPVGGIGTGIAKMFNPAIDKIIREDVRNFKQYIETGEIPVTVVEG